MEVKSVTPPALRAHACWGACGQVFEGHRRWESHRHVRHMLSAETPLCSSLCPGLTLGPPKPITDRSLEDALFGEE